MPLTEHCHFTSFITSLTHPPRSVYSNGVVCISSLHPPGTDSLNEQETAEERWRPILGVESVLVSVISLLSDPNQESPANIDAAVHMRDHPQEYNSKVRQLARKTVE
eukprot:GHVN01021828.1.p1 GENE.GHVN01021828.1~~GHVN01021828.1.p1  ORF type:complete len:107 (-),score=18.19 GHVN01021828.1:525-845(-)